MTPTHTPAECPPPEAPAVLRRTALALLRRGTAPAVAQRELSGWGGTPEQVAAVLEWALVQPDIAAVAAGTT